MKGIIIKLIILDVIIALLGGVMFFLSDSFDIAILVATWSYWMIKLTWIIFAIWFIWPYIKRGFQWLVDHREG